MSPRNSLSVILGLLCLLLPEVCFAHPPSGIVVDAYGHVYLLYEGLMRLESTGKLATIQPDSGGHWLALNPGGDFLNLPSAYKRVSSDGTTMIYGDGAPLTIGSDGNLYYATNGSQEESFPTGALAVARVSHDGQPVLFSPSLKEKLAELKDGVTGLASGPNGSIYVATWKGMIELKPDGSIARIVYPVVVRDCDSDPADHNPANVGTPLLRGLGVGSAGNVYVAATSCHRVLEITPAGHVTSILRSERPWSPTGVAVSGDDIYVLEFSNANGPRTEGWYPRLRKRSKDGSWTTLAEVLPQAPSHK
jgi:hypothetical protein